jgi:hypothetical protein
MMEQAAELGRKVLQVAQRNDDYLQGRSHVFAIALAKVSDLELAALVHKDESGAVHLVHAFVVAHHDSIVDIKGLRTLVDMYRDFKNGNHTVRLSESELCDLATGEGLTRDTLLAIREALPLAIGVYDIATAQIKLDAEMLAQKGRNRMVRPPKNSEQPRQAISNAVAPSKGSGLTSNVTRMDFSQLPEPTSQLREAQDAIVAGEVVPITRLREQTLDSSPPAIRASMLSVIREAIKRGALFMTNGTYKGEMYDAVCLNDQRIFAGRQPPEEPRFLTLEEAAEDLEFLRVVCEAAKVALSRRQIKVGSFDPQAAPIETPVLVGCDAVGITSSLFAWVDGTGLLVVDQAQEILSRADAFVALPYKGRWCRFGVRHVHDGNDTVFLQERDHANLEFEALFRALLDDEPDYSTLALAAGPQADTVASMGLSRKRGIVKEG